jgi:uncharacterized protein YbjT (DUF2867 family)
MTTGISAASPSTPATVVLAGATGDLGGRVARKLRARGTHVRALVRPGAHPEKVAALRAQGVTVTETDFTSVAALVRACEGAEVVISTLSGLRDVIVDTQTRLLDAAVEAGVPRFIPSDFAIDFTRLPEGSNRNLDLRRAFAERLDVAPIRVTGILNGMFTDLLVGAAPLVLFGPRRILYWGDADQAMDFTTTDDTASYTAAAALDPTTPRYLRIAGDVQSARGLRDAASDATGQDFRLLRAGSLRTFGALIPVVRAVAPARGEVFPPWQGMQYLHDMLSGRPKFDRIDNDRYPELRWTSVRDVLASRRDA